MFVTLLALLMMGGAVDQLTVCLQAPTRDGFVDTSKDIEDSIKDIRGRINHIKELRAVDSPEGADMILTVVARGVGSEAFGHRLVYSQYYRNAVLTSTPVMANTFWVTAVLEVGEYKKEFSGAETQESSASLGAWTSCARQIGDDLKAWALANAEQLRERRPHRAPSRPERKPSLKRPEEPSLP